jgi:hypothetical protein
MSVNRVLYGHYEVGDVIGWGGMANVHRGRDIRSGRAELIDRQPGNRAIYAVLLTRSWKRIFVATKGDRVVTALPPTPRLKNKWRRFYRR